MVNATGSSAALGGSLRIAPQLPQRRGLGGDVRYVFTALFGASRARRELSTIENQQTERQKSRHDRLITIGKSANRAVAKLNVSRFGYFFSKIFI